ncbi:MAG: zinc ribbon domain-containing protein [Thermoanaerobaculia bacterium]|nr:zinc ribbon domain-containing protein [Thermoanaerobaculia bacterium]
MPTIEFTGNYEDLSTDKGYQFKFYCEKCGNGYMSSFSASALGLAASAAQVAGNIFGGLFGRAASSAYEVQRAVGGKAHDAALGEAVAEIKPKFVQCTRCGKWVCRPVCFNTKAGLCEWCAPDLDEEMAAAQAEAARDQVHEKVRSVNWLEQRDVATVSGAVCPSCGAKTQGGKFCPDCGASLAAKRKCGRCGTEAEGSPKFCPECGAKYS